MDLPDQLVTDIKSYLMKKPLGETYGLYTKLVLAESESRRAAVPEEIPVVVSEGDE